MQKPAPRINYFNTTHVYYIITVYTVISASITETEEFKKNI